MFSSRNRFIVACSDTPYLVSTSRWLFHLLAYQSAYREGYSTETALVFTLDSIFSSVDTGKVYLLAVLFSREEGPGTEQIQNNYGVGSEGLNGSFLF